MSTALARTLPRLQVRTILLLLAFRFVGSCFPLLALAEFFPHPCYDSCRPLACTACTRVSASVRPLHLCRSGLSAYFSAALPCHEPARQLLPCNYQSNGADTYCSKRACSVRAIRALAKSGLQRRGGPPPAHTRLLACILDVIPRCKGESFTHGERRGSWPLDIQSGVGVHAGGSLSCSAGGTDEWAQIA